MKSKDFKQFIESKIEIKEQEQIDESSLSMDDFILKVKLFNSLDDALLHLPDKYTEFYLKNINNKKLDKELKKLNLTESEEEYEFYKTVTTGVSPEEKKYKKINYKGQYIILTYDKRWGWVPNVSFRSIKNALEYVKNLADEFM
jgi:hypothetical protein